MSTMLLVQLGLFAGLGALWSVIVRKQHGRMRPQRIERTTQIRRR